MAFVPTSTTNGKCFLGRALDSTAVPYVYSSTNNWNTGSGPEVAAKPDADRHSDGADYCFLDGHVKWLHYVLDTRTGTPLGM